MSPPSERPTPDNQTAPSFLVVPNKLRRPRKNRRKGWGGSNKYPRACGTLSLSNAVHRPQPQRGDQPHFVPSAAIKQKHHRHHPLDTISKDSSLQNIPSPRPMRYSYVATPSNAPLPGTPGSFTQANKKKHAAKIGSYLDICCQRHTNNFIPVRASKTLRASSICHFLPLNHSSPRTRAGRVRCPGEDVCVCCAVGARLDSLTLGAPSFVRALCFKRC